MSDDNALPVSDVDHAAAFQGLIERGLFETNKPESAQATQTQQADPAKAEPTKAEAPPEPEKPEYSNLEEYLQKSGLEPDSFFSLPTRVKIDGKEQEVTLADLRKSYGLEKHLQAKSIAFSDQQKAWEAERSQVQAQLGQRFQQAQSLVQLAQGQLNADFQSTNWNELYAQDPGRFAAEHQRFQMRQAQINQYLNQIQYDQQNQQVQGLQGERNKMFESHPEWRDSTKFQEASKLMSSYATENGFNQAEISNVYDHRYMSVLHDAARAKVLQAENEALKAQIAGKTDSALKQVRAAPQMAAPGARTQSDPSKVAFLEARKRMEGNPRDDDAASAAFESWARMARI